MQRNGFPSQELYQAVSPAARPEKRLKRATLGSCVRTVPSLNHPNERKSGARWGPRYGTRVHFPSYPALRLRLRAKLSRPCGAGSQQVIPLSRTRRSSYTRSETLARDDSKRGNRERRVTKSGRRRARSEERHLRLTPIPE